MIIVLLIKYKKQTKIVKEYEELFGPIGIAQAQFARFGASDGNFTPFNQQLMDNPQMQNNFYNTPFTENNVNITADNDFENQFQHSQGNKQVILNGEVFDGEKK